jgi:hypothetical protein
MGIFVGYKLTNISYFSTVTLVYYVDSVTVASCRSRIKNAKYIMC